MARRLRIAFPGAYYHVTSRGNEQKEVCKSQRDRQKFLEYLQSASQRYGAVVHVYCLMSNHYHLLLETPQGNLSQIHVEGKTAYRAFITEMVGKAYESPLQKAEGTAVLGTEEFIGTTIAKHIGRRGPEREVPALRQFSVWPSVDDILRVMDATFGPNKEWRGKPGCTFATA